MILTKLLLVLTLLNAVAFAGPAEEARAILKTFKKEKNLINRLDKISASFLGKPYGMGGPLGEGPDGKYDQDPLYRFDTFDCTTYVETMMSLALSKNLSQFEYHQDHIRYEDGEVDYLKRNHFTDLQWIPYNVENGYLEEINELVLPAAEILVAEALINLPGWLRAIKVEEIKIPEASVEERRLVLEDLHNEARNFAPQVARVPYIAIARILAEPALLNKIPSGTLVNFVRPNWDLTQDYGTHQNISHQGFLFRKGTVLYLRHAGTGTKKVDELPFIDYLKPLENHRTLKGIHLMGLAR